MTGHGPGAPAGARQPKGVVEASLVPEDQEVGSVLRAEVETGLEGIEVISLSEAKPTRSPEKSGRIEVVGTPKRAPDVSVILAPGSGKRSRRRDEDGDEREDRRPGRGGSVAIVRAAVARAARAALAEAVPAPAIVPAAGAAVPVAAAPVDPGPDAPGRVTDARRAVSALSHPRRPCIATPCWPRFVLSRSPWRSSCCAAVCQRCARQSMPRTQRPRLPVSPLCPPTRCWPWRTSSCPSSSWPTGRTGPRPRRSAGKDFRLRELRAVVAASRTVILDEDGRALAKSLQESLDKRTTALREEWLARITNAIKDGRIQQALEASIRPPEPGTRCPADLAVQLAAAAGEAMTAELPPEEWMRMLDAVVALPCAPHGQGRRHPDDEVARQAARHAAGSVPALAKLLGLRIPPPPPRRLVTEHRLSSTGG